MVPKPTYERRVAELKFYEEFFASVSVWLPFDAKHLTRHVIAAVESDCQELVTSEKPGKPIHRTKLITVLSIDTE